MTHRFLPNFYRTNYNKILKSIQAHQWLPLKQQHRNLSVHEYISYTFLHEFGISVPLFGVARTKEEAKTIAKKLALKNIVLKAQVLAGGRGKGTFRNGFKGGVRMVSSPEEAEHDCGMMLGQYLVTKQTGSSGRVCNAVMVAEQQFPKREFYFAIMMERAFGGPVVMASSQGGVNIEEVALKDPKAIHYEPIDFTVGLTQIQTHKIAKLVGLGDQVHETNKLLMNMYRLFVEKDALLIEINPYAEDDKKHYYALDAKFRFDDNADFRQKGLFKLRDFSQEDPKEAQAHAAQLNYIALKGNVGCMVNGAGLAMATMDIITNYGGHPANFLDVGGTASPSAVKEAFRIITEDPQVKSIFVNIFGGIIRCDIIAEGIISAAKDLDLQVPVVVRLQGTNHEKAQKMINEAKLHVISQNDFDDAAKLVVHQSTTSPQTRFKV